MTIKLKADFNPSPVYAQSVSIQTPNTERIGETNYFLLKPVPRQRVIDVWSNRLKYNLIYAKIALDFVDRRILITSTFPGRNGMIYTNTDFTSMVRNITNMRTSVFNTSCGRRLQDRASIFGVLRMGNCGEMADMATSLLRSVGIFAETYTIRRYCQKLCFSH